MLARPSKIVFLNQVRAGQGLVHAWFLKITSVRMYVCVCVCVCVDVCVSAPQAIKKYSREIIDYIYLRRYI